MPALTPSIDERDIPPKFTWNNTSLIKVYSLQESTTCNALRSIHSIHLENDPKSTMEAYEDLIRHIVANMNCAPRGPNFGPIWNQSSWFDLECRLLKIKLENTYSLGNLESLSLRRHYGIISWPMRN